MSRPQRPSRRKFRGGSGGKPGDDRFFALSPDLMCVAGFDGYFRCLNPSWETTLGWTLEELKAKPWLDFVHPDDRAATVAAGSRVIDERLGVLNFHNRYVCKDGSYRWFEWMAAPSPGEDLIYAIARDVTQARAAQERIRELAGDLERKNAELQAANRELEAFSYSVSHDLRAPLRSIDGFSLALLEDYGDKVDAEGRDALERVRAATVRMGRLIDDLLQLSRVTRSEMTRSRVDLSAIAASVARELAATAPERRVEFVIQPGVVVEGDERLLGILLTNLLDNGWKYTAKKAQARIEFGGARENGVTSCFVRDDGAGFDMAYAQKLFGVFQRLHSASEFPGTGIGLATVQRIVQRHGGRIAAEGRVGEGATFRFAI